jgi:hypothetical protein
VNDAFLNGSPIVNENAPVGLKYRIDNAADYGVPTEMKIDAGAVDLSLSGMTQLKALAFLEYIQQLLQFLKSPDGNGVVLYMNEQMERRFASAVKIAGEGAGFSSTKDNYDRMVKTYGNAKIRCIGRKADQTTQIVTSTEAANGTDTGASVHTSIYGVRYGRDYFSGWQFAPMRATPQGATDDAVMYRWLFEHVFGLWSEDNRCFGRVHGIKLA